MPASGSAGAGWTDESEQAFVRIKNVFVTTPILAQSDPEKQTVAETNTST
jgi:hypothetical protein